MNKLLKTVLALTSVVLLGLTSCGQNTSSNQDTSSGELPEYVGGDDWDNSWDDPWENESVPDKDDSCNCSVCGKCLDPDCTADTEKCFDLNGRTKQLFYGIDDKVGKTAGSMGDVNIVSDANGGYIGNFSLNVGCTISYSITSPKAEDNVCFGVNISRKGSEDFRPFSLMTCKVNDADYVSKGILHKSTTGADWTDFGDAYGGCVSLKEGKNTFTFASNSDVTSFNFAHMFLIANNSLTLNSFSNESNHECTSKNGDGKCTDYDCNKLACLDKDETGWTEAKLAANDSKLVAIREDGVTNMYNQNEDTIGEVNNHTGQKIAFAFTSTQSCYARVSIEHNGCGRITFASIFHMFVNNTPLETEGRTGGEPQDWFTYYTSTVGYIKLVSGNNTFQFNHDIVNTGFNIKSITLSYQSGTCAFTQASIV